MSWPTLIQLYDSQHSHSYDGTEIRETWYVEPYDAKTAFISACLGQVDPNSGKRTLPASHFLQSWCYAMQCDAAPIDQEQLSYAGTANLSLLAAGGHDTQISRIQIALQSLDTNHLAATTDVEDTGFVSQANKTFSAGAFVVVTYRPAITAATPYNPSGGAINFDFLNLKRVEKEKVNVPNAGLRLITQAGLTNFGGAWYPAAGIAPEIKEIYQEITVERRMLKPTFDLEKLGAYANFVNKELENFPNWSAPGVGASLFNPETLRFKIFQDEFIEVPTVDANGDANGFCQWLNLELTFEHRMIRQFCVFSEGGVVLPGTFPVTWNHVLAYPGTLTWLLGGGGLGWYYAKFSANAINTDSYAYPRCPTAGPPGATGLMDVLTQNF